TGGFSGCTAPTTATPSAHPRTGTPPEARSESHLIYTSPSDWPEPPCGAPAFVITAHTSNTSTRSPNMSKHKAVSFSLGRVVATPAALTALAEAGQSPLEYIARHATGDWGDALSEADKQAHAQALKDGTRLLPAYLLPDEPKLWIIPDGVVNPDTRERYPTT